MIPHFAPKCTVASLLYTRYPYSVLDGFLDFKYELPLDKEHGWEKGLAEVSLGIDGREVGSIFVYHAYAERLLKYPKPLREQLIFELPFLQAFRSGEISTLRVEYPDFENGDLYVLDSKKARLIPVPLNPTVAEHLAAYIEQEGLKSGLLIQSRKKTRKPNSHGQETSMAVAHIGVIWDKYCRLCGIPILTPRHGRAYFAAKWHFIEHKSLYGLMTVLRHTALEVTERYLARIVDYQTVKTEFYFGLRSRFQTSCANTDKCPISTEGCHCKFYVPSEPQTHALIQS